MKPSFPHWGNLAQRLIRNSEQNIDVQHVWVISDVTTKICKLAKMEKIVVTHISFHKVWRRVRANRWPIGELPSLRATRVLGKQKQKKKKRNCTATKTTHWNTQIEAAIIPFFFPSHKPLLMSAWNRSVTALFGLIGIRCMSLTAEVEGFFFFCSGHLIHDPFFLSRSLRCIFFGELSKKKKKNPKHAESFAKWDISWLIRSFSHHITTATLSLSTSFFPHPLHRHPSGALFNSIPSPPPKLPLFLFLSFSLSLARFLFIFLFLSSFPSSPKSLCVTLSFFLSSQPLYFFYELRR